MGEGGAPSWPECLGYIQLPEATVAPDVMATGIRVMEEFAQVFHYRLGEVFVDDEPAHQMAWAHLIDVVRTRRPIAVLVPDVPGLRLPGWRVEMLRARLRRATSAPLVAAGIWYRPSTD